MYSSFLSKHPVSLFIGSWPYSFKLGVRFCIYVKTEVYNTSRCILSFGWFPDFYILCTDVSEYRIKMPRKHPKQRNNIHNMVKVLNQEYKQLFV